MISKSNADGKALTTKGIEVGPGRLESVLFETEQEEPPRVIDALGAPLGRLSQQGVPDRRIAAAAGRREQILISSGSQRQPRLEAQMLGRTGGRQRPADQPPS